jgi:hypothetical protein
LGPSFGGAQKPLARGTSWGVCELCFFTLLAEERHGEYRFRDFVRDEVRMRKVFQDFENNFYSIEQRQFGVSSELFESMSRTPTQRHPIKGPSVSEVHYRVPLFRVWGEHREMPWPDLLNYWGLPNLQVINRDVHALKCTREARDRRATRLLEAELN